MTSFNFTELMKTANESDMEPMPPTSGHFKVIKAEAKKTAKGKDMIAVRFKSLEGESKGKAFNNNYVISPESANALWMFFKQMEAFGLTKDGFFATNPSMDKTAKTLLNRVVWLKVTDDREWNGRKQNEIAEIAAPKNPSYANPGSAAAPQVTSLDDDEDDWKEEQVTYSEDPSPMAVGTEEDMTADEEEKEDEGPSAPPPAPF